MKSNKSFPGFTLVELIVVITILAILGTIGFISIQGYSSSARDSSRISNLVNLHKGLAIFNVAGGSYPMPENPITITASGTTIGYQGFARDQVAGIAKLSAGATKDPLDPTISTTYATNALQTKMQLMAFLEDGSKVTALLETPVNAATNTNYSTRFPTTKGDTIGILLGTGTTLNQPVQELLTASLTGIDVVSTSTGYTAYITKNNTMYGTGSVLKILTANNPANPVAFAFSCKEIIDSGLSSGNGYYYINPTGTGSFKAYCDMATDGGGWTLVANASPLNTNHYGTTTDTNISAVGFPIPLDYAGRKMSDTMTKLILGSQGIFRAQVNNKGWTVFYKVSDNTKFSFAAGGGATAPYGLKIAFTNALEWESDGSDPLGYLWGSMPIYKVFDGHNFTPNWFSSGYHGKRVLWGYDGNPGVFGNGDNGTSYNGLLWVR